MAKRKDISDLAAGRLTGPPRGAGGETPRPSRNYGTERLGIVNGDAPPAAAEPAASEPAPAAAAPSAAKPPASPLDLPRACKARPAIEPAWPPARPAWEASQPTWQPPGTPQRGVHDLTAETWADPPACQPQAGSTPAAGGGEASKITNRRAFALGGGGAVAALLLAVWMLWPSAEPPRPQRAQAAARPPAHAAPAPPAAAEAPPAMQADGGMVQNSALRHGHPQVARHRPRRVPFAQLGPGDDHSADVPQEPAPSSPPPPLPPRKVAIIHEPPPVTTDESASPPAPAAPLPASAPASRPAEPPPPALAAKPAEPPAPPAPPPVRYVPCPPGFRLAGTVSQGGRVVANVNGRFVGVGDEVNGAEVVAIDGLLVTMQRKGERFIVGFGRDGGGGAREAAEQSAQASDDEAPTTRPAADE